MRCAVPSIVRIRIWIVVLHLAPQHPVLLMTSLTQSPEDLLKLVILIFSDAVISWYPSLRL